MQNNSDDLCLLIGIYSFILFYLLLLCVFAVEFFFRFFSFVSLIFFLRYHLCLCVCVCLNTDGFICSWNVCDYNPCSSLFAIYSHDHHQYHFQYTHAFDYFKFFSSFASDNTEKEKKCTELTFAQTVIIWSLWIALLNLNGLLLSA